MKVILSFQGGEGGDQHTVDGSDEHHGIDESEPEGDIVIPGLTVV